MPVVAEQQRDRGARVVRLGAVVEADRLVSREQVVGPAVRDQQWRRRHRVVDVVARVVLGDRRDDVGGERVGVVGLAGVDQREPGVQVGVRARQRVVAGRQAGGVEPGDERLLHHADLARRVGSVGDVVERPAVRHQRVGEIGPGDVGRGGRKRDRRAVGLRQGASRPFGTSCGSSAPPAPSTSRRRRSRRSPRSRRIDDPVVHQQPGEVLGVADLVVGVHQVVVAVRALRGQPLVAIATAAVAPAAVAHRQVGVAPVRPALVVRPSSPRPSRGSP